MPFPPLSPLFSSISFVLLSLFFSLSISRAPIPAVHSHLLFSSAAVTAATLRLICADGRKHTGRRSLARAKPGRVKIKSELICHERAPRLLFYPPRTLRRISVPPPRQPDSSLTISTAVCLYQRSKSFHCPRLPRQLYLYLCRQIARVDFFSLHSLCVILVRRTYLF